MRLPVGYSDFKKIVDQNFDFVDKSLIVKEVLDDDEVILITRPRRFGKTFNLSILRYFFENKSENSALFKQLAISKASEKYLQHQNQYPVISFSFKGIKKNTPGEAYASIHKVVKDIYSEHRYLLGSDTLAAEDKLIYQSILNQTASDADLADSLKDLIKYLHDYHNNAVVVLIDEYDTPIQSAYLFDYYEEIVNFFRNFFGAALKDNRYLFKAVLTGILRVSRENLFSGLNNIVTYSMVNSAYGAYFGFTEDEVETLLQQAGLIKQLDQVRDWYNGYRAGDNVLYNPWSIASYIKERVLKPYWINTSDNALIKEMLINSTLEFKQQFEPLLSGESVSQLVDENFVFSDLQKNHDAALWSLLFMAGYLKIDSHEYTNRGLQCRLSIPDKEVRNLYQTIFEDWLTGDRGIRWYDNFLGHLLKGDTDSFSQDLKSLMEETISIHDAANKPEAFYHGLMIGLTATLYDNDNYELRSNRESGDGRYDYFIISRDDNSPSILMEFKKADVCRLDSAAKLAVEQMDNRHYLAEARQRNIKNLLKIGIAFHGKNFSLWAKIHEW